MTTLPKDATLSEDITLHALPAILSKVEKAESTPTPKALRERKLEDGSVECRKTKIKNLLSAEWWQTAGVRAIKTMVQTGAALFVTQMPGGIIDWQAIASAALLAGITSLVISLAGLLELE
jgi:hypothetical protein